MLPNELVLSIVSHPDKPTRMLGELESFICRKPRDTSSRASRITACHDTKPHQLQLSVVEFKSGTWQGIVEILKQGAPVDRFEADTFIHCGEREFLLQGFDDSEQMDYHSAEEIEEYVVEGRDHPAIEHPSLPAYSSHIQSIDYLWDLLKTARRRMSIHGLLA